MLLLGLLSYIFVQVKKIYILNVRMDEVIIKEEVIITDKVIRLDTYKEGLIYFKEYDNAIRKKRNELLQKTDYMLLADSNLDEASIIKLKIYRQELRDYMNRLSNDEIQCNIFLRIDEFVEEYFPKL